MTVTAHDHADTLAAEDTCPAVHALTGAACTLADEPLAHGDHGHIAADHATGERVVWPPSRADRDRWGAALLAVRDRAHGRQLVIDPAAPSGIVHVIGAGAVPDAVALTTSGTGIAASTLVADLAAATPTVPLSWLDALTDDVDAVDAATTAMHEAAADPDGSPWEAAQAAVRAFLDAARARTGADR